MKDTAVANVRNFALLGHTGSGKTTMLDAILHKMGVNDRKGSPADGTSMCDCTDEEKERKISVWAKPFDAIHKSKKGEIYRLVMIDTPGYADFVGQMSAAASVADAAIITVDAASGVEVGTSRAWKYCMKHNLPCAIVISGIDKENVNVSKVIENIQSNWGNKCVPVTLPTSDASKVVHVLENEDAPADMADRLEELKGSLVEFAAETDDTLMEKFFGDAPLTREEIVTGLRGAVNSGSLVPIFTVSSPNEIGVEELVDDVIMLFPSPEDREFKDKDGNVIDSSPSAPFVGKVWRSSNDSFVGHMNFTRVIGGTLKADSEILNVNTNQKERIGKLIMVNGKKNRDVTEAQAGDIVALSKLKATSFDHALCDVGQNITLPPIELPQPVVSYAVYPKSKGDEDKLASGLNRAAEDDPTLTTVRTEATHELILSGMGDIQINVAVENMKKQSKVEVDLRTPKVAYKETITGKGEGHYKHKKQSGGRGQYGEVYLRVEPTDPADEEWFVNAIVGGAIPGGFIPAVVKGLVEGKVKGCMANAPVVGIKVTLYDGSYHDVDSSEIAFKIAGSRALHEALMKAKPVLLEPIMKIKVMIPDQYMGDISGDMNQRRGRILNMGSEDGMQVVEAEVPQAEIFQYSSQLRSITSGRGSFEMTFERYDVVPSNIAQKVVEAAKHEQEEDH